MAVPARTGIANLPLHYGKAPPWLFQRMVKLARPEPPEPAEAGVATFAMPGIFSYNS